LSSNSRDTSDCSLARSRKGSYLVRIAMVSDLLWTRGT
jgi:hypothetical protein